jgi:type IV secretory pathway VirJ component
MRRSLSMLAMVASAGALISLPARAETRSIAVTQDVLGEVKILAPSTEPTKFVIYISGQDGLTATSVSEAEQLTSRGAAVALIDLPALEAIFAKRTDDDCYYVFGEFEDLSRIAQRQLGMSDWQWPILFGTGEGGTLAYLALAQAPANTAGGAVSLGFTPNFRSARPLCPGAPKVSEAKGFITYEPIDVLPAPWSAVLGSPPSDKIKAFANAPDITTIQTVAGDEATRFEAAAAALFTMKPPAVGALSDLPLSELPAQGPATKLVILLSGDGGWRDIDKQIGEYLSEHGVAVVGLDSLRYFWSRKDADQIASDLQRIADHYLDKWKLGSLALVGYSFGADVLPMTWPQLEPKTQSQTELIALLGFEPTFDLEVSVSGWLGVASSRNIKVQPYLAGLPKSKVLCFYGIDDKESGDTACVLPELKGATLVERPGGHHFDGNYEILAEEILKRLKTVEASR